MPLYEYQCRKCGEQFETLVSLKELDDPVKCPHCGSHETDKLLSTFSTSASSAKGASCSTSSGGT